MARFTVHVPAAVDAAREGALERSVFVRDGWSWGACLFGPLWLMRHRHFIAGFIALLVMAALLFAITLLPVPGWARSGVLVLLAFLWGLEGASLRRLALARGGYAEEGVVIGTDREALEQRFFAGLVTREASFPAAPSGTAPAMRISPVIGSFPDARKHP